MTIAEKKILTRLKESKVKYELFEHEAVYTCEQAARVRGVTIKEGIKCLLFKTADKSFILALTRGDKRIDLKKIAALEGVKKLTLASEKEVEKLAECKIGCVHPFCNADKVYFDEILLKQKFIEFNPGCHNKTVRMEVKDLLNLLKNPQVVEIGI